MRAFGWARAWAVAAVCANVAMLVLATVSCDVAAGDSTTTPSAYVRAQLSTTESPPDPVPAESAAAGSVPAESTTVEPQPQPATTTPPATVPSAEPTADPGTDVGEIIRADPSFGNAAQQAPADKRREASRDCVENRPPISKLLGVGGTVSSDEGTSWSWLLILVAGVAFVVAVVAFALRVRRSPSAAAREPRGALETLATLVAIVVGVVGVVVQFVPGVGVKDEPAPVATMRVRDVNARITRGEFAKKTGSERQLSEIDRRQVGNVVWLEITLQGYAGKHVRLQYALFDPQAGGPLLPHTARSMALPVEDKDTQTSFTPIWVGYPKSERFSAQFRLLEGKPLKVRQMASTGAMRGSEYRYACGYGRVVRSSTN